MAALALYMVNRAPVPLAPKGQFSLAVGLEDVALPLGAYELKLEAGPTPHLAITARGRPVFEAPAGQSPLMVTKDRVDAHENRGMVHLKERRGPNCANLTITGFSRGGLKAARAVTLNGTLACPDGLLEVWITFQSTDKIASNRTDRPGALAFDIRLGEDAEARGYRTISLIGHTTKTERFYGFGAQMSRVDFKGERFPLVVSEQGIGRGLEPISSVLNWFYGGAQGNWHSAYAPNPMTLTSKKRGAFLASYAIAFADLRDPDRFVLTAHSTRLLGGFLSGEPLDMISDYTENVGRQRPLPDWAMSGAILGLQGGTQKVREKLTVLKKAGMPIVALWLQDWVGQRITDFGKQLWWSWTLDETRYPEWSNLVSDMQKNNVRLLGYINPFLVDTSPWQNEHKVLRRNLFLEALEKRFLVLREDGKPYLIKNTSFEAGLLDLSNKKAQQWILAIMQEELINRGFSGWMADFGEGLPFDGHLSTSDPDIFHNAYPDVWANLNRRAIQLGGLEDEALIFHRSGHFGSAGRAPAFWLGDQLVTWDAMDGFRSAIIGHQSSSFSGHGITHADIGGYTTIENPLANFRRDQELLLRWAEFAAFTPLFRSHEGNIPEANHQIYSEPVTAAQMASMARLYACLKPARARANEDLRSKGWPISRHPALHYPDNPTLGGITYEQIMLGDAVMVAPVSEKGATAAKIILPEDGWVHLWTKTAYAAGSHLVEAPIGQPAAFIHRRSPNFDQLMACSAP